MVRQRAAQSADATAYTVCLPNGLTGGLSFADVDRLSDDLAAYFLRVLALARGERVAVMLPNCLAYPVAAFGAFKAGLAVTGINPLYTAEEIAHQLRDCGASTLVTLDLFSPRVVKALESCPVAHVIRASVAEFFPRLRGGVVRVSLRLTGKLRGCPGEWPTLTAATRAGRAARAAEPALVERSIGAVRPEEVALLQYTGGTTGVPKAAMLTHRNLLANTAQIAEISQHYLEGRRELVLTVLPLYHIFAFQINGLVCFRQGYGTVLVPSPKPLSNLEPAFRKFPITFSTGVNTLLKLLLREPWFRTRPPRTLRLVYAGGAAVEAEVVREWAEITGGLVTQGYGLSEASPCVSFDPVVETEERGPDGRPRLLAADPDADGLGLPMPMTEIRIVGEDGAVAPVGGAGEIELRGPQVMPGYWNNPDETAAVFHDGWLRTGDIGRLNDAGRVTILDRKKDLVLVSGFNVFPNQVEASLVAHPAVSEAAVVGVPDDTTGEAVVAFVVCPGGGVTGGEIRAHCREHLAAYKIPKRVVFRAELPKTAIGKVDRKRLRAEARGSAPAIV
jgi:long-chain acyl-CoA synthetase